MSKSTISVKDTIQTLMELGVKVSNQELSDFFAKKGIQVTPHSIRAHKSNLSRR